MHFPIFPLFFLLSTSVSADPSPGLDVQEFHLKNGLEVLILERHNSPSFAAQVVYKVGSVNERPGITGVSHLIEHLMFKGTQTIGTKDYAKERIILEKIDKVANFLQEEKAKGTEASPARIRRLERELKTLRAEHRRFVIEDDLRRTYVRNGAIGLYAATSADYTHYDCTLPSDRLELWCLLESDRMCSPVFRQFYAERDAVARERAQTIDKNPPALLWEQMVATAFVAHPYQWPVLGWMSDITLIKKPEVEEFWRKYYAPNNCTLVLVGDIYAEKALPLIEKYFGDIPSRPVPDPPRTVEPPQVGERRVTIESAGESLLYVAYHKPAIHHADQYVFDVIEALLCKGQASRLYKTLVLEKQSASRVKAYGAPDKYPGLFVFALEPTRPRSTRDVLAAFDAEIAKLTAEPVDDGELETAKNLLQAEFFQELETNRGTANQIAFYEALLDWKYINTLCEHRNAVTPADIQRVASEYFIASNRTVAELVPCAFSTKR